MFLVLDKSFLQGARISEIQVLYPHFELVMPEVLFLEIMTSAHDNIRKCFMKFPQIDNPVSLIPNVGTLIRTEMINHASCSPLTDHLLDITFNFNRKLRDKDFSLTPEDHVSLAQWKNEVQKDAGGFGDKALGIHCWFPKLISYKPGGDKSCIEDAENKIVDDHRFICDVYDEVHNNNPLGSKWPSADKINCDWIVFRYFQTHLLGAVDYVRKYGLNKIEPSDKQINEVLDLHYCIVASLFDGLATRDKNMARIYKLMCPNNKLLQ